MELIPIGFMYLVLHFVSRGPRISGGGRSSKTPEKILPSKNIETYQEIGCTKLNRQDWYISMINLYEKKIYFGKSLQTPPPHKRYPIFTPFYHTMTQT